MPKISIKQDILAPEYIKTLKLSGYHPSEVLKLVPNILMEVFRQQVASVFEDQIKWDVSDDPLSFSGAWRMKDGKDKRTTVWVSVIVEGEQSKKDMSGKVTIILRCQIETNIEYKNMLDKSLLMAFDKLFYQNHRITYIEEATRQMLQVEDALKKHFGAMEREKSNEIS